MSNSVIKILVLVSIPVFVLTGYLILRSSFVTAKNSVNSSPRTTVFDSDGVQIIELTAKAGYSPSSISAKAGKDTILRVITNSTFDCSSALTIPKLGIRKNLPPTSTTDISLGSQDPGTKLAGTCAMGMYNFSLSFN